MIVHCVSPGLIKYPLQYNSIHIADTIFPVSPLTTESFASQIRDRVLVRIMVTSRVRVVARHVSRLPGNPPRGGRNL